MNVSQALATAGFKPEKSTVGDKPIFTGIYRASFFDWAKMEDKGYGESIYAQFKVQETLSGDQSYSKYPEFKRYFNLSAEKIASKKNGLAALINGLFSAGTEIDASKLDESLTAAKGSDVWINAYPQEPRKQVGTEWVDDPDGEVKQGWNFMTKANAEKKAEKTKKPF